MAELALEQVRKSFNQSTVIHDINLAVRDGEFVVFVGPSGCGKSTLLRLIAGLDAVSSGQIRIGGRDVSGLAPADRGIAMVFQSYALYPHMTVAKNLSFGLENLRMPKEEIAKRVQEAARMLAIDSLLERKPKQLSGGQRQRVAIGRAIVRDPAIFLFDEPLSNLDAALRVQTRAEISALHKRLGATMIYVTHDQIEAMTMADRIVVLQGGRLEQFGAPLDLFERPANRFVAGFIGSPRMNFYDGRLIGQTEAGALVDVPGFGELTVPVAADGLAAGAAVELGLRPNHFTLEGAGRLPMVRFAVERAENVGTETYVYGRIHGQTVTTVLHVADHLAVRDGEVIELFIPLGRCHLFAKDSGLALPLLPWAEGLRRSA